MARAAIRLWLFALLIAAASSARAQSPPPAAPPITITPPALRGDGEVPYPPDGHGDASVVLELVVAPDGKVSEATVVDGVEPFARQARDAVLRWQFTPARRGTQAVAARIGARVDFRQEAPPSSPPPPGPTTSPAAPPVMPQVDAPLDVTVRGKRREIGQTTLTAADVREMPGAFGDPFRAIEALPSVAPIISGLPYFYIRGAPPNDNAYYVDGVRVPFLFHVGIGAAVIHPALVDRIDFFPSAAPAAYGNAAGGIIAGQTRAPAADPHGEANLRLFDAGALVETPFHDGRGTVLLAGRYGYPGPIVGALASNIKLGYWDYQARATWRLTGRDTVGVFAFGSHDYLGTASTNNGQTGPIVEQLASDFHRVDLRYDHALTGGNLRVAATLGHDTQGGAGGEDHATPVRITDPSGALRLELDKRLTPALRFRAGATGQVDAYSFHQPASTGDQVPVPASVDPPPTNLTAEAHADVVWRLGPRIELVPGLRAEVFESWRSSAAAGIQTHTRVPVLDPRLSIRVVLTPSVAWLAAAGIAHQFPALRVGLIPGLLLTVPGFPVGDHQLQRALQAAQGFELSLPAEITATATGFLSYWSGLTDLTANCLQIMPPTTGGPPPDGRGPPPEPPYTCPSEQPLHGYAYGLEVLVRRSLARRLAGWVSYTLSRSRRQENFITPSGGDAVTTVPSDYDRTHLLNAVVAADLGRHWRAGARAIFYSGVPYSDLAGNVPAAPYNDHRTPSFFRLDVRLEKRWELGHDRAIAFVLEGQNVTLSKQATPLALDCIGDMMPQGGTTQCTIGKIGPLTIPSVGVQAFF
ncbi:MAG TPA: energy transducer TonB [Polyangia bacterium]|nr:energy transducer TonB [Polyangia bacterium]